MNDWVPSNFKFRRFTAARAVLAIVGTCFALTVTLSLIQSLVSCVARADEGSINPDEYGIEAGYLLPSRIPGMTEVMPIWGLHYGVGLSFGEVEFDGDSSHASGSDYYSLAGGLRGSTPIFPAGNAIYFGGIDETVYRESTGLTNRTKLGFHFGGGLMLKIIETVWFRTDARFVSGPGSILKINLGFVYRAF